MPDCWIITIAATLFGCVVALRELVAAVQRLGPITGCTIHMSRCASFCLSALHTALTAPHPASYPGLFRSFCQAVTKMTSNEGCVPSAGAQDAIKEQQAFPTSMPWGRVTKLWCWISLRRRLEVLSAAPANTTHLHCIF
ncbi:hypothetical protein BGZ60DRAFT_417786 [Tricladium varicosporioides]|nr:hypothetical protein BGZ60DRAFT_417786 [Hymenoscyphus varicosporioides]